MKRIAIYWRMMFILGVMAYYRLDHFLFNSSFLGIFRFFQKFWPGYPPILDQSINRGNALRLSLQALGPIFVKLGQALSTRKDILPGDMVDALTLLQDRVQAFSGEQAKAMIEKIYQASIETVFASFDLNAIASASIAQVHGATLHTGESVAVKILRPNIEKIIQQDLDLIHRLGTLACRYSKEARRLRLLEVIDEFKKTLIDELDLSREAANAAQLRRSFEHSLLVSIPKIYWQYTQASILVQDYIHGIPVNDLKTLDSLKVDRKLLAQRVFEIFLTQVLRDGFFHADMHPGNLFVSVENPSNPRYIFVDFGIVGTLNDSDKYYLAENFHALCQRDYRRVAQLHIDSGWVPTHTREDEFESAVRTLCEPLFERPLHDISCARMLLALFQTGRRFHMPVLPQFILLQKTLLAVEGLSRQLYPELDLFATIQPLIDNWVRERCQVKRLTKIVYQRLPLYLRLFSDIPQLTHRWLSQQGKSSLSKDNRPSFVSKDRSESLLRICLKSLAVISILGCLTSFFLGGSYSFAGTMVAIPLLSLVLGIFGLGTWITVLSMRSRRENTYDRI